jgi:hypothetical protein
MNFTSLMVDRYGAFFVPGRMLMDGAASRNRLRSSFPRVFFFWISARD